MQVHARFYLSEDARVSYWTNGGYVDAARFKFAAVKGEPFGPATPQGQIDMLIVNPEALALFRGADLGQEFDVVFSLVEKTKE